jgi:hypothetical protein
VGEIHINKGRVGEERKGKETDVVYRVSMGHFGITSGVCYSLDFIWFDVVDVHEMVEEKAMLHLVHVCNIL